MDRGSLILETSASMNQPHLNINRVYFMIHPTCWAEHPDGPPDSFVQSGRNLSDWYAAANWEKQVNRRQKELIDRIGPDEALVIFPIGSSPSMRDLEEHGQAILGRRCLVLRTPVPAAPSFQNGGPNPVRRFLDGEDPEEARAFWDVVPHRFRDELVAEFRRTAEAWGWDWTPSVLRVTAGNWLYAKEIADEFEARGLEVDPPTVSSVAFGEGFEQCAVSWKSMVADYLGWAGAIENSFDLSVSAAHVLFDARFKERLALERDIRLFLWEKSHGRHLGLYVRARSRLGDPHFDAHVPLDGAVLEAWGGREKLWPAERPSLSVENGRLRVPGLSGMPKATDDETCYLVGCNLPYKQFRDLLAGAAVTERYW